MNMSVHILGLKANIRYFLHEYSGEKLKGSNCGTAKVVKKQSNRNSSNRKSFISFILRISNPTISIKRFLGKQNPLKKRTVQTSKKFETVYGILCHFSWIFFHSAVFIQLKDLQSCGSTNLSWLNKMTVCLPARPKAFYQVFLDLRSSLALLYFT